MKKKSTVFFKIGSLLMLVMSACSVVPALAEGSIKIDQKIKNNQIKPETIFGRWSRSPRSCARPELIITENQLKIQDDADGEPVQFTFSPITFEYTDKKTTLKLRRQHGYGHTPSKENLSFEISTKNAIKLETKKFKPIEFIRCKKGMEK